MRWWLRIVRSQPVGSGSGSGSDDPMALGKPLCPAGQVQRLTALHLNSKPFVPGKVDLLSIGSVPEVVLGKHLRHTTMLEEVNHGVRRTHVVE